jgi:hypothetical protein
MKKRLLPVLVLLLVATACVASGAQGHQHNGRTSARSSSLDGSPPPRVPADTLVPNVRVLSFKLGSRVPASQPISKIGTGMYRSVDRGVTFLVWRNPSGIVDHVEAPQADRLRLDGRPLSAGYRAFRGVLMREGWKSFGCGGGVRGLTLAGRFHSLTFVRWSRRNAWASISLPSQPPVFGVCEGLSGPPPREVTAPASPLQQPLYRSALRLLASDEAVAQTRRVVVSRS